MKMFIPTIGTIITLTKNWEFDIHEEYRNYACLQLLFPDQKIDQYGWRNGKPTPPRKFAFKKGSVLKVDRIYIRKGKAEYDSISFVLQHDSSGEISKKPRFWVKLADANTITCELGDLRKE